MKSYYIPPIKVAKEALIGLLLRRKFGRGGTDVGLYRARQLSSRSKVYPQDIQRMYSFFARHEVDKQGKNWDNKLRPSNGRIAWLLWGGDAGKEWADRIYKKELKGKIKWYRRKDVI